MSVIRKNDNSPFVDWYDITPDDEKIFSTAPSSLYVGGAGDVAIVDHNKQFSLFKGVQAGTILEVRPRTVLSSFTTATDIVADTQNDEDALDGNMFVLDIRTNPGTGGVVTNDDQVQIHLRTGETYDCLISWGDGTYTEQTTDADPIHTYATAGDYTVRITGVFPGINVGSSSGRDRDKYRELRQWGIAPWAVNSEAAFAFCDFFELTAKDVPNFSQTTDIRAFFRNCIRMTAADSAINDFDVSGVTDFWGVFQFATQFNAYIGDWDVRNGQTFGTMFEAAFAYDQPLTNWNTKSLRVIRFMFNNSSFTQSVANFDISNLIDAVFFCAGRTLTTDNYDETLISWAAQAVENDVSGISTDFGNSTYSAAAVDARATLVVDKGWTIIDGGPA